MSTAERERYELAQGYLTLKAERDAERASLARQWNLMNGAPSTYAALVALERMLTVAEAERDALKERLEALGKVEP